MLRRHAVGPQVQAASGEADRIDVAQRDELLQHQGLVLGRSEFLKLFGFDDDAAVAAAGVAFDDGVAGDRAMRGTALLVLQALAAAGVQEVEVGDGLAGDGGVSLDGQGHEAEAKQTGPTGPAPRRTGLRRRCAGCCLRRAARSDHGGSPGCEVRATRSHYLAWRRTSRGFWAARVDSRDCGYMPPHATWAGRRLAAGASAGAARSSRAPGQSPEAGAAGSDRGRAASAAGTTAPPGCRGPRAAGS